MGLFSGLGSALGELFDPGNAAVASNANQGITSTLAPDSPYWQSGQVTGDTAILQGAAGLQNAPVSVNTGNVDADAAQFGALGTLYGGIAANGGQLTEAVKHQAAADLANTDFHNMKAGSRQASGTVLDQDQAERNWAASGQTQSRAQVLANMLQKQTWNTAVSHANFEAALAGKSIQYQDQNLAGSLGLELNNAANQAAIGQTNTGLALDNINNNLGTQAFQGIASALSGAASTGVDMYNADQAATAAAEAKAATQAGNFAASNTYALPQVTTGRSVKMASVPTVSKYVNPVTGDTVDPNIPTTTASWGDWLTGTSLVA